MNDSDVEQCVELWIGYTEWFIHATRDDNARLPELYQGNKWEKAFQSPESWWKFLVFASKKVMPDEVWANLAAGPMEDFLCCHGREYLSQVVSQAKINLRFRDLLGGVWQNCIEDDVWAQIVELRTSEW